MTIQELYDWARNADATGAEIRIQYQDGGGVYVGDCEATEIESERDSDNNIISIILA